MTKRTYLGVIERGTNSFGIIFPDFPGCTSVGETLDHVLEMGREALTLHIEGMVEDGETVPPPSDVGIDQAREDYPDGNWIAVGAIAVTVPTFPDTVAVSLKADLVRRIAEQAEQTASKISAQKFVEDAVRRELERRKKTAA